MDSQNEDLNSIFERFRGFLLNNQSLELLNEFNEFRRVSSKNKFRMFLSNALVLMRTWSKNENPVEICNDEEDWDRPSSAVSVADRMENCAYLLFLSIVDYLKDSSEEGDFDLWKRIVANRWTIREKFYLHLHREKILPPARLTRLLYNDLYEFYVATADWSSSTKVILIEMGFLHLLISDNVFLGCNHILLSSSLFKLDDFSFFARHTHTTNPNHYRKLVNAMNSPEKAQIFLEVFPQANFNEFVGGNTDIHQQRTPLTIFDRFLKMECCFYEKIDDQLDSKSIEENHRTENLISLFVKFIEKNARISIPLDAPFIQNHRIPFYLSTVGFYLLSIVRYRDFYVESFFERLDDDDDDIPSVPQIDSKPLEESELDLLNNNYIQYLVKRASTFTATFRSFFFEHLMLSTPYLHSNEFFSHLRSRTNVRLRLLYDELVQHRTSLTLKQRCRLKIKSAIKNYPFDLKKLHSLPSTLQNYLSFDLFHPNLPQLLINQFEKVQGRVRPSYFDELQFHEHSPQMHNGHYDWEDQIPEEVDQIDDFDQDEDEQMDDDDEGDLFDEEQLYDDNQDDEEDW